MIFETHAHYDDEQFNEDREILLEELHTSGIDKIINAGASLDSTRKGILIAEQLPYFYAAAGVHPSDIRDLNEDSFKWLREQCANPKVVAVGEIGLDYYWDKEEDVKSLQRYWFKRQMELARETSLPVIIHSRDAAADTLHCMKEIHAEEISGVIHCYSYSIELAREFLKMGYFIGIGGVVTFKNAKKLKEVVAEVPLESLVLETDAPYLAPEPFRGQRNRSDYLIYVAAKIAEIKDIPVETVQEVTYQNAKHLFTKTTLIP
ncbi:MAG: TatD family hydrolase [Lachnospiraceae bacterium]